MLNMLKIVTSAGTADQAPSFLTGIIGLPTWSGKKLNEMTDAEIRDMCTFAETEGERAGWLDADEGKDVLRGELESNPFHRDFLGAVPHQLWRMAYRRGVRGATAGVRRPILGAIASFA